jgi:transposase
MEKRDARTLKMEVQQELRYQVVRMKKAGMKNQDVAKLVGLSIPTTSGIWAKYKREGMKGLILKTRGRKEGEKRNLTPKEEALIIKRLIDTTPQQLKFKFVLWTREAVKQLIKHDLDIDMPISTVGYYLQRWEFTSQVPIKRAYERSDAKVQQWLQEEYPLIQKLSKEENAQILWADETACVSLPSVIKGYAPKGKTPVMEHTAKRFKINMISSISNRGKLQFMLYEENMDANLFVTFLERLIQSNSQKIHLILDNLRVHHSKIVKAWVEEHKDKISLFYLPAYSPDLNPDEYLNNDFKRNVNKEKIPVTKEELKKNTESFMQMLSKNEIRVANYFKHPKISYAA